MKTNRCSVIGVALLCATITVGFSAGAAENGPVKLVVSNGEDDVPSTRISSKSAGGQSGITSLSPINHVNYGEEAIRITSLCSASSPTNNLYASYHYAMAGLMGIDVPRDRVANPAAWYVVPTQQPYGWQWFDAVSTDFHSFLGSASLLSPVNANEHGHRLVVHVSGRYPVSAYKCRISCSLTNTLARTFAVGTNTLDGSEIHFGPNFIGISTGTNGVCESFYDPSTGSAEAGGDDTVYQNGQIPSQVVYDWWVRFGSTSVISIEQPADFADVRAQFASNQWFKAELLCSDALVSSNTIVTARPQLSIQKDDPPLIRISIIGGQENAMYGLLSSTNITGAFEPYWVDQTFYTGSPYAVTNDVPAPGERYFKLIGRAQ